MNGTMIWRVSTDKGFQQIEAPSHKAAVKLAKRKDNNCKVLRVRSTKTPLQLHLRSVVQNRRQQLVAAKAQLAGLIRDFAEVRKEFTGSQLAQAAAVLFAAKWEKKIQDQANLVHEAKRELFEAEQKRKNHVLVA